MTKKRRPVTEHSAIALTVAQLSDLDIADATGKSVSYYRQCSDPDISTHNISFIDAAKLAGKLSETGHAEHFSEAFRNLGVDSNFRLGSDLAHDVFAVVRCVDTAGKVEVCSGAWWWA